jgi:hypothetical protein
VDPPPHDGNRAGGERVAHQDYSAAIAPGGEGVGLIKVQGEALRAALVGALVSALVSALAGVTRRHVGKQYDQR